MGKGDKKTARGKRIIGSSGVTRQKKKATFVVPEAPVKKPTPKKAPKKAAAPKKTTAKKAAPKKAAKEEKTD